MTLYTDIPTRAEIDALWNAAFPTSVSLYVPTEPASSGAVSRCLGGTAPGRHLRAAQCPDRACGLYVRQFAG
jgi:hypothetical protein